MFFDDIEKTNQIIRKENFSIFLLPKCKKINYPATYNIFPDEKNKIGIEEIRNLRDELALKQTNDITIVINQAEKMNIQAQNAFLKLLEEPPENCHIVFFVNSISTLLQTIMSRAALYIFREKNTLNSNIDANENIKIFAKKLLASSGKNLTLIVDEIQKDKEYKKKENSRIFVLNICSVAIEMAYKSYFKTNNAVFIKKLANLITLQENLKKNGNIKLHLVADLC